jgi:phosphoglucosamine mutase
MESLIAKVIEVGADLGIAHDGDADRCLAVDHEGNLIDGDFIMAILASSWKEQGRLKKDTVVATVMSNLGFMRAMESLGINVPTTAVGDRYVLEQMIAQDYALGGEQSGHVIMRDFANTGDGILTALQLMQAVVSSGKSLKELSQVMKRFPQSLINVEGVKKENLASSTVISNEIKRHEEALGKSGRILVRASGTEALVRVMVEAESNEAADKITSEIASLVQSELK